MPKEKLNVGLPVANPYPKLKVGLDFEGEESRTKQEFAGECNINNIVASFQATGHTGHLNPREGVFDTAHGFTLDEALIRVRQAEAEFMQMSAETRKQFKNDPRVFVEFASDPDNFEACVEMGIFEPPPADPDPVRVEVINQQIEPHVDQESAQ
jgi:hypothetical protein